MPDFRLFYRSDLAHPYSVTGISMSCQVLNSHKIVSRAPDPALALCRFSTCSQQQYRDILRFKGQDIILHLHGCAIGDGLVRVDGLAELLAVEEVLQHFLDLGNARRAAHQHYVMDAALVHLGILTGRSVPHTPSAWLHSRDRFRVHEFPSPSPRP